MVGGERPDLFGQICEDGDVVFVGAGGEAGSGEEAFEEEGTGGFMAVNDLGAADFLELVAGVVAGGLFFAVGGDF